MSTPYVFKDLNAQAQDLLLWQYKNTAIIRPWITASLSIASELQDKTELLHDSFGFGAEVVGLGLDLVGQAIGLERFVVEQSGIAFQWDVTPWDTIPWGDDPTILYELLPDNFYRRAILSFGYTSNTISTNDAIIQSLSYLLDQPDYTKIVVTSPVGPLNAEVTVTIDDDLSFIEEQMLRHKSPNNGYIWAKTAGIRFTLVFNNGTIEVS